MTLHLWWLYVVTVFFVSATPGPNMLHIMSRSVELGLGRALPAMAGCMAGIVLCVGASALGLTALLLAIPGAFAALRLAGAAYLVWLGYKAWTAPDTPFAVSSERVAPDIGPARVFATAFMVAVSNPKTLLFAAALFPQFIDSSQAQLPQFALMVLTLAVIEISWYFAYAVGGRGISAFLERPAPRKAFNRLTGAIFIVFGLAMAVTRG